MTRPTRLWCGVAVGLALAVAVGCGKSGPKRVSVSGQVTYAGQAVPTGRVSFIGSSDVIESAPISDGKYTIEHAPVGPVKVTVSTPAAPTGIARKQMQQKFEGKSFEGAGDKIVPVPEKYTSPETSGLTYTVTDAPAQSYDIALTR